MADLSPPVPSALPSLARWPGRILILAGNLLPLAGLRYWGWDAFQLLMLYWMETVIVAALSLTRIALLPPERLGTATVNGRETRATNAMMVGFFALHSGIFMTVHLFFLWGIFSGDWPRRLHGIVDIVDAFLIRSGAWMPLALVLLAGLVSILLSPERPRALTTLANRIAPGVLPVADPPAIGDGIGPVIGNLYGRIVIMQVAIIFGAWFAQSVASLAPLVIVILLKTIFDFAAQGQTRIFFANTPGVVAKRPPDAVA